jgi:hypothetical protein
VAEVAVKVEARGHVALAPEVDDGVSGDVPAAERAGWRRAVARVVRGDADGIAMKEFSRFSREHPAVALVAFDAATARGLRFLCLADAHFSTAEDDGLVEPSSETVLLRFVTAWSSWAELVRLRSRTQSVMDEITAGRRATKTGRPPGRPEARFTEEEIAWARAEVDGGRPLLQVHDGLLRRRGYYEVRDPEARKRRYVSRASLARALGRWQIAQPAQNPGLHKTGDGATGAGLVSNGPVVSNGGGVE